MSKKEVILQKNHFFDKHVNMFTLGGLVILFLARASNKRKFSKNKTKYMYK